MIVNTYAVLALFLSALELSAGLVAAAVGLGTLRALARGRTSAPEVDARQFPLLALAAVLLVGLAAASAPLLYLLLDSYVGEWPGVMCVEGVTAVGSGSLGAAGWLPALLGALVATKSLLLLLSGAWLVLHLVNRRTRTGPLARRVVGLLAAAGAVAALDASAEIAYVAIPKKERFLSVGCCTTQNGAEAGTPSPAGAGERTGWTIAYFGLTVAMTAAVASTLRRGVESTGRLRWGLSYGTGAAATLAAGCVFFPTVLAPARLSLPLHECGYCLLARAPETAVGIVLLAGATACIAWAWLAASVSTDDDARPHGLAMARSLLRGASFGYPGAGVLALGERWLV